MMKGVPSIYGHFVTSATIFMGSGDDNTKYLSNDILLHVPAFINSTVNIRIQAFFKRQCQTSQLSY